MNEADSSLETVSKALKGIADGDLEACLSHFDDEPKWNVGQALPEKGLHQGRDAVRDMLVRRRERFPNGCAFRHLTVHGTKDHVFAEYTRYAKDEGREHGEHCLAVFELVVGKIREVREFTF